MCVYIYIYIYIYSTVCFDVSQLSSVARHVRLLRLSLQITYVSSGIIMQYVVAFVCLHFALSDTRVLNSLEELCITWMAVINSFARMMHAHASVCDFSVCAAILIKQVKLNYSSNLSTNANTTACRLHRLSNRNHSKCNPSGSYSKAQLIKILVVVQCRIVNKMHHQSQKSNLCTGCDGQLSLKLRQNENITDIRHCQIYQTKSHENIWKYYRISKTGDLSRRWAEGPLFYSYYTEV